MSTTAISRVFMSGNSQAVRIPAEFRLDAAQVRISRNEQGDLVLRPVRASRGSDLLAALKAFDEDFVEAVEVGRQQPLPLQERESV